jgi:hypothetical protein
MKRPPRHSDVPAELRFVPLAATGELVAPIGSGTELRKIGI